MKTIARGTWGTNNVPKVGVENWSPEKSGEEGKGKFKGSSPAMPSRELENLELEIENSQSKGENAFAGGKRW